ncbi:hypothetical protein GC194_01630 [bacterium]|nr:hypothetical protein [bacterium]
MESIEAKKLINRIQKSILSEGADSDAVVDGLKELRPYAIEEKDPTVTRVIRTTYEHIEEFGGFHIAVPADEEDEDEGPLVDGLDEQSNSLYYLVSLLINSSNPRNREEIIYYRDALKEYWLENA